MNSLAPELRPLRDFLAAYFHEDWVLDAPTPGEIIQRFTGDSTKECIEAVVGALDTLLQRNHGENALADLIFRELGCYCDYRSDGMTGTGWLKYLRTTLNEDLVRRQVEFQRD